MAGVNGSNTNGGAPITGTLAVKIGLAQMLKGGVIMDVVTAEQARIAEEAGACAVMALDTCSMLNGWQACHHTSSAKSLTCCR